MRPYFAWLTGGDAVERLRLNKENAKKLTIVCDLLSGACNPKEIIRLLDIGCKIYRHDRLHAKVFWTDKSVMVGSSNVSSNGLGFEGGETEVDSAIEGSILTDEPEALRAVRDWIDRTVLAEAVKIDRDDKKLWKRVFEAWKRRRNSRHDLTATYRSRGSNFWDEIIGNTEAFKDKAVYVWLYPAGELTKKGRQLLTWERKLRKNSKIDAYMAEPSETTAKPGDYIIAFWYDGNKFGSGGIWKILEDEPWVMAGKDTILLCVKVNNYKGMSVSGSLARVKPTLKRWREDKSAKDEYSLYEFARILKSSA